MLLILGESTLRLSEDADVHEPLGIGMISMLMCFCGHDEAGHIEYERVRGALVQKERDHHPRAFFLNLLVLAGFIE
jgi:hypothetical protein